MKDVIIVDNSAYSYLVNEDNAIPIIPYYDDKDDVELKIL